MQIQLANGIVHNALMRQNSENLPFFFPIRNRLKPPARQFTMSVRPTAQRIRLGNGVETTVLSGRCRTVPPRDSTRRSLRYELTNAEERISFSLTNKPKTVRTSTCTKMQSKAVVGEAKSLSVRLVMTSIDEIRGMSNSS